ncbi:MAG: tRNA 2-thiouridine(34) synthase MnmA, partial [Chloroflexota bacterium]
MSLKTSHNKKSRAVVAMSGGVDSSVAAALMVEAGYEVIGLMMRLWSEDGKEMLNRCCTPEQMDDARQIAGNLGIPFYVVDVKDYFKNTIVDFYLDQHKQGRTPNPCIECNREIRFNWLYERAMALNADYLVTGHYAQIKRSHGRYELHSGIDDKKDQSYVLHMLDQAHLAHVKFPIGEYTKPEVRQLAQKFDLPVASKSDSMDLCFLSGEDYRDFL